MSPQVDTTKVPKAYLQDNGKFKIGMDGRYRGDLIAAVKGEKSQKTLHEFTKPDAMKRLRDHGWTHFLPEDLQSS